MERNTLNEALKAKEAQEAREKQDKNEPMKLDDSQRIKVLSPNRMVLKRFSRNKLAIFGLCVLILMFLFSFAGPLFYSYGQTEVFTKNDYMNSSYASAKVRTDYQAYTLDEAVEIPGDVSRRANTYISSMLKDDLNYLSIPDSSFAMVKVGDNIYTLSQNTGAAVADVSGKQKLGKLDRITGQMVFEDGVTPLDESFVAAAAAAAKDNQTEFSFDGNDYELTASSKVAYDVFSVTQSIAYQGTPLGADFEAAVTQAIADQKTEFTVGTQTYLLNEAEGGYTVQIKGDMSPVQVLSVLVFDTPVAGQEIPDELRNAALLNAYNGETFEVEGVRYTVANNTETQELVLQTADGEAVAYMTNLVIRDTQGNDNLSLDFKRKMAEVIHEMQQAQQTRTKFTFPIPKQELQLNEETGTELTVYVKDENGNQVLEDATLTVNRLDQEYQVSCPVLRFLIDTNRAPDSEHVLGTDVNGMDNLARMMFGGRISLMVGFVVVFISMVLGIIMGGISGYFGGWVDTLIMRLVDIFYCIPSWPILIILGAMMDAQQMGSYVRLMYMMAVLGFLSWAGVARLVRGQILSLREQEFMIATEATGVRVRKRIFRHLVPNVMPQLIVSATGSLGSVILTESALSFLGLGVKFPLATWGNIINMVTSSNESMLKYTYIWIPVGLLICLTVVAFNFVGDGLRDAFDPKMKR